jgi:putative transposase
VPITASTSGCISNPITRCRTAPGTKRTTVIDNNKMKPLEWLSRQLEQEGNADLLRDMVKAFAEQLMSAEASQLCGAEYGKRSPDRTNSRNGHRMRRWDTRAGTVELAVPKLRQGSYFPEWLLEPRRRAERAMTAVIAESYVAGVSTRRVEKVVQAMGIEGISKSQVSKMAAELDEQVEQFRSRPLDAAPYRYVWMDAVTMKCREGGCVVSVACLIAVGVNAEGKREILGLDVVTTEDGAGWLAFLRGLVARGLSGVELVISDAHAGLVDAIRSVLLGAQWQRCRTHFMRNLLTRVPKKAQNIVATLVRSVFLQPDAQTVRAQHSAVVEQLMGLKFDRAADLLVNAQADILAFADFPTTHWKQIWSNNPQERLNKEIRRRTDVVGIFPNRCAIIRLIGAVLAEQNDEWIEARRYMSAEVLKLPKMTATGKTHDDKEKLLPEAA